MNCKKNGIVETNEVIETDDGQASVQMNGDLHCADLYEY